MTGTTHIILFGLTYTIVAEIFWGVKKTWENEGTISLVSVGLKKRHVYLHRMTNITRTWKFLKRW